VNALRRIFLVVFSIVLLAAVGGIAALAWNQDEQLDLEVSDLNIQAFIDAGDGAKWALTGILAGIGLLAVIALILAIWPSRQGSRGALRIRQSDGGTVHELYGARNWAPDRAFDRFLPDDLRIRSALHWTPQEVAVRAATWIDDLGIGTVVDIGSGVGKFCIAAAFSGKASYVGIEQRGRLVEESRRLVEHFGLEARVRIVHGTLGSTYLPSAEAYYMYNPFGENLFGVESRIDSDVELSEERYRRDVETAERTLAGMPLGTFLITYNGFGGQVPPTFRRVRVDRDLPNVLVMWEKSGISGLRRAPCARDTTASAHA